jgi:hypothetical protein
LLLQRRPPQPQIQIESLTVNRRVQHRYPLRRQMVKLQQFMLNQSRMGDDSTRGCICPRFTPNFQPVVQPPPAPAAAPQMPPVRPTANENVSAGNPVRGDDLPIRPPLFRHPPGGTAGEQLLFQPARRERWHGKLPRGNGLAGRPAGPDNPRRSLQLVTVSNKAGQQIDKVTLHAATGCQKVMD